MKKRFLLLLLLTSLIGFSQDYYDGVVIIEGDSIVHNKNTKIEDAVSFKSDLKEKYNSEDFIYKDDLKEPESKEKEESTSTPNNNNNSTALVAFGGFMSYIFPFLLGIIIVIIILKTFLGTESGFWNFKSATKKVAEKLVYEDEDIHESDFPRLLEKAILEKNFRLATRYYYLSLLKKLSDKKTIEYHKDKTNTEYTFEIENKTIRKQFSEVSYIYSYVWYGEFPIDSLKFKTVEKKYKSIFNSIN
ncbi:hypothetical protein [Lacinutrix sp. Bg11-31]|uniref:hypothetical protein n=1 Tax=Lacinutrix sp. Bg11-31 TaxID=2057808 RepID=UPI000C305051|nr:hypothetical protein [Lacinutrix sp. Bg11-31]AUC81394.1 hypothetical protein CW733_04305 [Lacinutrix sp. Bg11-31]